MPQQKAEALFDFNPTAAVELGLKVIKLVAISCCISLLFLNIARTGSWLLVMPGFVDTSYSY